MKSRDILKKGENKLKLLINQELDVYSIFPFFEDKDVILAISMGKLLENGNIQWSSALRFPISIPFNQLKLILDEYEIDNAYRTTWDYFKIVEEEDVKND
ncbi:hypothetical protein NRK67_12070 [Fusobacteria bacterium ZRK30]|nr:hypothetical protein NRK67_12070 [Fusobacteria bacterium ZRK30]